MIVYAVFKLWKPEALGHAKPHTAHRLVVARVCGPYQTR